MCFLFYFFFKAILLEESPMNWKPKVEASQIQGLLAEARDILKLFECGT